MVPTVVMGETPGTLAENIVDEDEWRKQKGFPPVSYRQRKDGCNGIAPDLLEMVWREYLRKTGQQYHLAAVPCVYTSVDC